jgi:hypothetical protein
MQRHHQIRPHQLTLIIRTPICRHFQLNGQSLDWPRSSGAFAGICAGVSTKVMTGELETIRQIHQSARLLRYLRADRTKVTFNPDLCIWRWR